MPAYYIEPRHELACLLGGELKERHERRRFLPQLVVQLRVVRFQVVQVHLRVRESVRESAHERDRE